MIETMKITDIVDFNPTRTLKKGILAPFVEMAAIPEHTRDIARIDTKEFGSGSKFKNGDTLFARITPCLENGKTAKVGCLDDDQIAHGSTEFIVMSAKSNDDEDFVYYLSRLPEFREYAKSRMQGTSGRQRVSWQALADYEFSSIVAENRKEIGKILRGIDDKIALNREMNKTLEAMAQAIFKSWFVDFEPFKEGEFVESELGMIPKGWEVKQINEIAKVVKGKSYKSSELASSSVALVTLKSFNRGGGYRLDGLKEYIGSYKPEQEVTSGDLIIAYTDVTQAADVIGKAAIVIGNSDYEHLAISLDVGRVLPVKEEYKLFLYGLACTDEFQQHTYAHTTGTTVLHLSANAVPEFRFACPPDDLIETYFKIAQPLFSSVNNNIAEIQSLSRLRDTLLPKLLSGEIEV